MGPTRLHGARGLARIALALAGSSATILGCNGLLGIESAVFEPDATPGAIGGSDASTNEGGNADGGADAAADASPCVGVDFTSDPRHCGACNHDCLAGACSKGICQPFLVVSTDDSVNAVAVDATHAYWTNPKTGEIRRAPLAGGGTAELLFKTTFNTLGNAFTVAGGYVWFADSGANAVRKCAVTGCTATGATEVIGSLATPTVVTGTDAGSLYWSELVIGGSIGTCQLPCTAGGTPVATGETRPWLIAPGGPDLFWTTLAPTSIRAKLGAAAPVTIASPSFLAGLTVSGDRVFYVVPGVGPHVMLRDGGASELLTPGVSNTDPIVADATHVYFAEAVTKGRVLRCPVTGCGTGPQMLAADQDWPSALALDAQSVVWANSATTSGGKGAIMRVAK